MSPRLIIILAMTGIVAAGSVVSWIVVQPAPPSVSRSGAATTNSVTAEEKRRHREQFFGGDTSRDIRGGQEMKPRW